MIEIERTFLAKKLPEGLKDCEHKEIVDVYLSEDKSIPKLRLRKIGDKFELTKKSPIKEGDWSQQEEQTIILDEKEYEMFKDLSVKKIHKIRYFYKYKDRTAEIAVFQGPLKGLVTVEFEFETEEELKSFEMPNFCLADVTQEDLASGKQLSAKTYEEIEHWLSTFGYKKLFLD